MALLIAGSDTVGNTLAVGGFHVLNNPNLYEKLFNELKKNWLVLEKSLGYEELEKMPYLVCKHLPELVNLH
jgi:cytochrome P450